MYELINRFTKTFNDLFLANITLTLKISLIILCGRMEAGRFLRADSCVSVCQPAFIHSYVYIKE